MNTQGPWKVGFGGMDGDDYAAITSPFAEHPICHLEPRGYVPENAPILAASLELLEALELVAADRGFWLLPLELKRAVNSAIGKARNKQLTL